MNTYTTTARCIVRQILQQNNIKFNYNIYTNKCAELGKRNLCFTVAAMPSTVLDQIRAALNVKCVYTTATAAALYLRVVHCSYKEGVQRMFSAEEVAAILELVRAEASWYEGEEEVAVTDSYTPQATVLASIIKKINNS